MSLYDLNRATLIGNVTKEPELMHTAKGTAILRFSIATNRSVKKPDESYESVPTFHNIVAWSKLAERMAKAIQKGEKVYIEGRVENRSYEVEGVKKYTSEVVADNIITLKKPNKAVRTQEDYEQKKEQVEELPVSVGTERVNPDDLPF